MAYRLMSNSNKTFTDLLKGIWHPFLRMCGSFLIRRNSFQSWYLWQKSFSIDLTRRLKVVIPTLKDCLVSYERPETPYCVFWVEYRRELRFPREGVFEAAREENYFRPVAVLFRKKKKRRKDGGRTSEMCMQVGRK